MNTEEIKFGIDRFIEHLDLKAGQGATSIEIWLVKDSLVKLQERSDSSDPIEKIKQIQARTKENLITSQYEKVLDDLRTKAIKYPDCNWSLISDDTSNEVIYRLKEKGFTLSRRTDKNFFTSHSYWHISWE